MPRRTKYDLASIHAAMTVECPECHYRIPPDGRTPFEEEVKAHSLDYEGGREKFASLTKVLPERIVES